MTMSTNYYKMNKKALSGIVAAVVMVALVMALGGIVWGVVTNLVTDQLEDAGTCLDVLGKVSINDKYTCYDTLSGEIVISIGVQEINLSKIIIAVSGDKVSNSYELTKTGADEELKNYTDGTSENVKMPESNSGITYRLAFERPNSIRVIPVIGGKQCDVSDSALTITSCDL